MTEQPFNETETLPVSTETTPKLVLSIPESETSRIYRLITNLESKQEDQPEIPILKPATRIQEDTDGTPIIKSREDEFAISNDGGVKLDFTPVHACLGVIMRDSTTNRLMYTHIRKRTPQTKEELSKLTDGVVEQISSVWQDSESRQPPDEIAFVSEHLASDEFPYQQVTINKLRTKFQIPDEKTGHLDGYHSYASRPNQELPHGKHKNPNQSILRNLAKIANG